MKQNSTLTTAAVAALLLLLVVSACEMASPYLEGIQRQIDADVEAAEGAIFTVTFESNGGSAVTPQQVREGALIVRPDDPVKEGSAFDGWYKEESLTASWAFETDVVASNTTLYAKWLSLAAIETTAITEVTSASAMSGGTISSDGGSAITSRGVCWSISEGPTISDSRTADGSGVGSFTSSLTGLSAQTTYYVRAYATNAVGTAYGSQITFSTGVPTVTTDEISAITSSSGTGGGTVVSEGGASVSARGVCWSTSESPTISDNRTTDGSGTGSFTSSISGLSPGTTYYVRAYATNSIGTAYGSQVSFETETTLPAITTTALSSITASTASGGGDVTSTGGATVTARGVCWSTSENPTISGSKTTDDSGAGAFSSTITGLLEDTTYYVRAYATNEVGTAYGSQRSFTTQTLPTVATTAVVGNVDLTVSIGGTSATAAGEVTSEGSSSVTERGVCWNQTGDPTIGDSSASDGSGAGIFSNAVMTGLTEQTDYYVRAYATSSAGTAYGNQISFDSGYAFGTGLDFGHGVNVAKVFYNDGTGHGLAAALENLTSTAWIEGGSTQSTENGNTSSGMDTGDDNTDAIVDQTGHTASAASSCRSHHPQDVFGWDLPSLDELVQIWQYRNLIGGFSTGEYWSSTEAGATNAWAVYFGNQTAEQSSYSKSSALRVRPVRGF